MSTIVHYRMPPRVRVISNPHYTNGPTGYAPFALESLGPYPTGVYHINSNTSFGGSYAVTETTETSIKVIYSGNMPDYPTKTNTEFPDINEYEFAYKPYDPLPDDYLGRTVEKQYHPMVFDYSAENSIGITRKTVNTQIPFSKGVIPNYYTTRLPPRIYIPGEHFNNSVMAVHGFTGVHLPGLPGWHTDIMEDPTELKLIPLEFLSGMKGKYLVMLTSLQGFDSDPVLQFYPDLPNDRNIEILLDYVGEEPPNILNGYKAKSGIELAITYDSLFAAATGPGNSLVLPYRKNLVSATMPMTVTLPEGTNSGDLIYFTVPRKRPIDFKLPGTPPPQHILPPGIVPINVESIE